MAGRYVVERELARGGMAVVYLARDVKQQRTVAVKALRPELSDLVGRERFLREIEIASRLEHPHILPLYDSGVEAGLLYYVMPSVEGESLRDRLNQERQLSLDEALRITREVAEALAYAHERGIVHRDIKPENIMLSGRPGHARVADFGIAHVLSTADSARLTERGIAVGTPEYMSPEQASGGDPVDARSDIYSLGCVVYEMLAGDPPFTGSTAQTIIARQVQERPRSLRVVRPTVPLGMQRVIERALAKVPADRYGTVTEFAAALEATRSGRPDRRRRLVRAAAAVLLTGALLALGRLWVVSGVSLDARKVVVFPLADPVPDGAGEAVALIIASALEHTEPLKWIDGWARLDLNERADLGQLTARRARRISGAQGARYYIEGSIVRGDSLRVVLRLSDTDGDSLIARASAAAPRASGSLPQLGLQAVNHLLPRLLGPGRPIDLSVLSERHPAAIANWLQGEREYRQSHFEAALDYYRRAVEDDSALVVAALKGAWAADWVHAEDEALRLTDVALRRREFLPARYQSFALALRGYLTGAADSAAVRFRRAVTDDPTWVEAWMGLGEVYYHLLPEGWVDTLPEAAFAQAVRLDPGFAPALFHLSEIAVRTGQLRRAERLIDAFGKIEPDSSMLHHLRLMGDCARHGSDGVDWGGAARSRPGVVLAAAKALGHGALSMSCAPQALRAVLASATATANERWGALLELQGLLVAEGRYDEVRALLDSAATSGMPAAMGLHVVDEVAGAVIDHQKAVEAVAMLGSRYDAMSTSALWWRGVWAKHVGDTSEFTSIAARMAQRAARSGERADQLAADALAAHLALLRADTVEALRILRQLRPVASSDEIAWGRWEPLAGERMALAELFLARGEAGEALRVATLLDHPQPVTHLLYLPRSLSLRIQAAELLGQPQVAAQARARLEALRPRALAQQVP